MKAGIGYRIEKRLKDGIDERAEKTGRPATAILEEYIAAGLARDNGELIEQSSLPAIRAAVREEVNQAFSELYDKLSADMAKVALRDTNRLAALIVKAARSAGVAQRMIYAFMAKSVGGDFTNRAFEDAKEKVGKDIARPDAG